MRPPKSNLLACLGNDGLWHYCNVPQRFRAPEKRGHTHMALCGKVAVYAGDDHATTCIRCIRYWSTW